MLRSLREPGGRSVAHSVQTSSAAGQLRACVCVAVHDRIILLKPVQLLAGCLSERAVGVNARRVHAGGGLAESVRRGLIPPDERATVKTARAAPTRVPTSAPMRGRYTTSGGRSRVGVHARLAWHADAGGPEQWSEGHGLDVFLPALLDSNDLRFYGTGSANGAGFALNRSGGLVGVSNVFPGSADLVTVWSDLIVVAASMYPGFDLVGYELGADLQAALIAGFAGIGPLRVWMR